MGRHNSRYGTSPQRSKLVADKEERGSWSQHAFALFRPVEQKTMDEMYEVVKTLQDEEDIPASVKLFNTDLHCTLVQERRMRRALARGLAGGFAASTALSRVENRLSREGAPAINFTVKSVDVIGRNRNLLIANITDPEKILKNQREALREVLGSMGLKLAMDKCDHITLGESKTGLTATERKHVIHMVEDTLPSNGQLDSIIVEHEGIRLPLISPYQPPGV